MKSNSAIPSARDETRVLQARLHDLGHWDRVILY